MSNVVAQPTSSHRPFERDPNPQCALVRAPGRWTLFLVGAVFLASMMGCHVRSSNQADAAPPPSLSQDLKAGSPRAVEPLWAEAHAGDPLDLHALADREGAAGLLEGVEDGGSIGRTALLALPLADDAESAYARLGQIAVAVDQEQASLVLESILSIASRPRRQVEAVDPEGVRSCAAAMGEIASRRGVSAKTRATAISIARLFADRRYVPESTVPKE